jgi:hypothetical protein
MSEPEKNKVQVERVAPNDVELGSLPVVYSNAVQVVGTPWDIQSVFGTSLRASPNWTVRVVQSPPHAKAYLRVLTEQVRHYEEQFGAIPDLLEDNREGVKITRGGAAVKSSSSAPEPPSGPTPAAPRE